MKLKKNDKVTALAGKDKGKTGRVLRVIAEKERLLVEGVMMIKKHVKPNPQKNIQGGIAEQEATIHISNVTLPKGVTPAITDRDFTIATIVPPTVPTVADEEADAAVAEAQAAESDTAE